MTEKELRILRKIADELRSVCQEIHAVHEDQSATNENASDQPIRPLPIEVKAELVTSDAERDYYEAENREHKSWWRKFEPFVAVFGVAVALALAIVTFCTLLQVKRQADADQRQIDIIQSQFTLTERAWLFEEAVAFNFVETHPTAHIRFRNTGHTPAFDVTFSECAEVRDTEPISEAPNRSESCTSKSIGIIGPNVYFDAARGDSSSVLDNTTALRFSNEEIRLYYWGKISYTTLKGVKEPFRKFCFMTQTAAAPKGSTVPKIPALAMSPCQHGQEAQ